MDKISKETKTIVFSRAFDNRAKILYAFYFLLFFIQGVGFAFLILESSSVFLSILLAVISLIAFITSYRFGNKMLYSESAEINSNTFIFTSTGLLNSRNLIFERSKIKEIVFLTKPTLTEHPLAGKSFDYLGFETQGKMINEMHGDKRVAIDYNGTIITFGESLFSWHFEDLRTALGFYKIENDINNLSLDDSSTESGTV